MTAPNTGSHVLIVDDAPENIQVLSSVLYPQGIKLSIAQRGDEAINIALRKPPDLILLDIIMPEMDGFEVCTRLKEQPATCEIPIIFLTAKTRLDDVLKGFELGAVDYVTKPFHPSELLSRVQTHLELKRARDLIARQNQQLAEALRQNEQQYRFLVENVTDGIGIMQRDKLVFVNHALAAMLGVAPEQLLGHSLLDLIHDDYKADMEQTYPQLGDNALDNQWQILQCIVMGDGRELWFEGGYSEIEWEGQPAVLVSMRDISQYKQRELAIEREKEHLRQQNLQLKSTMHDRYKFGDIVGKSPAMQSVYDFILDAADSDANVVVYGESGTGKELIAQTIHAQSARRRSPFVPVNCGAIQETLFESEFFGHRKGAFTGAYKDKPGFFDRARGGTLFLDELEALSPTMQAKLLRAVEGGGYTPVGSNKLKKTNARIIAATNMNVVELVEQGLMREDFFYRMCVITIVVPPLRDRREDLALLIDCFLHRYSNGHQTPALSGKMLNALYDYDWPGNVRELQNTIQRFMTTKRLDFVGTRKPGEADESAFQQTPNAAAEAAALPEGLDLQEALDEFEKRFLAQRLYQNAWNRRKTAKCLRITERTLYRKMQKYHLKEAYRAPLAADG
jgi:PAS domain S-box-containing protein